MHINQLIAEHGPFFYLTVFVWTFLEGETVVICAGFAAAQGLLDPFLLTGAAWLGSFAGDQCYFWIARRCGTPLLDRHPRWHQGVDKALHWLERYNTGFILTFRFIYGLRNISSFALGLSAVGWRRFLKLNFAAAGIWAVSFVTAGYFLGHAWRTMLGDVARSFSLAMLAVFVAVAAGVVFARRWQRRRRLAIPVGAKAALPSS